MKKGPVLYRVAVWVGKFSLRGARANARAGLELAEKPKMFVSNPEDPNKYSGVIFVKIFFLTMSNRP